MNNRFAFFISILALSAVPSFAQEVESEQPPVRAEDPAYLEDERSGEEYTVDEPSTSERRPAAAEESEGMLPDAQVSRPGEEEKPVYLESLEEKEQRRPAAEAGRTETRETARPTDTQLAFFEISPVLGAISIEDKTTFSTGANLSFRISDNSPLFFEPSALVSFLSGDNNQNATLFHIDAGLRIDWVIGDSPVIPFVKAAVGPTLSSSNDTVVNGETISDSYFNAFLGGGLKLLINPRIGARFDTGVTFQGTDPGLYVFGAASLPL